MSRWNCGSSATLLITLATLAACTALAATPDAPKSAEHKTDTEADKADSHHFEPFKPESITTSGSVTIAGRAIPYQAVQGVYEMHHLPIPQNLQTNIEYCFYESGHMVYAKDASLRQLHDNVADFIRRTSRGTQ